MANMLWAVGSWQVILTSGDASDAKHKRRRRSRGSTFRDEVVVKPPSREIGIQVEISPMPKKSPSRFLSFGKRSDSSNGVRRDGGDNNDVKTTSCKADTKTPTKTVEIANVDATLKTPAGSPAMTQQECDRIEAMDNAAESKRNRKKSSVKNREKNIFNKVRKMSQFISALKNSTANKRRKADEVIAAAMLQQQQNNGQCCQQHCSSDAKRDSIFGNVTFEEMNLKDNSMLGLPQMNIKFSKVFESTTSFDRFLCRRPTQNHFKLPRLYPTCLTWTVQLIGTPI